MENNNNYDIDNTPITPTNTPIDDDIDVYNVNDNSNVINTIITTIRNSFIENRKLLLTIEEVKRDKTIKHIITDVENIIMTFNKYLLFGDKSKNRHGIC